MLAGAAVQASAANIVADPGFESGTPNSYTGAMGDGWQVTAGTGAICNVSGAGCGNAGPAHTGTQMAFLDWSNSFDTISQTLTTVIGQTYTISFWVASDQPNFLNVTFGGSTLFNGTAPAIGDYVQFAFDSTAASTSTVLAFSGQRTAGGIEVLDDVSVSASGVPEPATWLLTPVALLGLGALRRRHQISPRG
jgi:MYXO-CTERM domain-containing protein